MNVESRIREVVTMEKAFERYCPQIKCRGNRAPCPIHGGTHDNMTFTDTVFYCHVCHAGGDVIGFVQQLFKIDRARAVLKLSSDYGIYATRQSKAVARAAEIARKRYNAERAQKLAFHKLQVAKLVEVRRALWNLEKDDIVRELDDILDHTDQGDNVPDENMFTEDITDFCIKIMLTYVGQTIEDLENERREPAP